MFKTYLCWLWFSVGIWVQYPGNSSLDLECKWKMIDCLVGNSLFRGKKETKSEFVSLLLFFVSRARETASQLHFKHYSDVPLTRPRTVQQIELFLYGRPRLIIKIQFNYKVKLHSGRESREHNTCRALLDMREIKQHCLRSLKWRLRLYGRNTLMTKCVAWE